MKLSTVIQQGIHSGKYVQIYETSYGGLEETYPVHFHFKVCVIGMVALELGMDPEDVRYNTHGAMEYIEEKNIKSPSIITEAGEDILGLLITMNDAEHLSFNQILSEVLELEEIMY